MACEICCNTGLYPIHNRRGAEVYQIICPECHGNPDAIADFEPAIEPDLQDRFPGDALAQGISVGDY